MSTGLYPTLCCVCNVMPDLGDHGVIAKETARQLGLGTNIQDAAGLPNLDKDGKVPKDLGKKYGQMILAADGFAQVSGGVRALSAMGEG